MAEGIGGKKEPETDVDVGRWLLAVFEDSDACLFDCDLRTDEVRLGAGWKDFLDDDPREVRCFGRELMELVHPDDAAEIKRDIVAALKGTTRVLSVNGRIRAADGAWRWVFVRGRVTGRDAAGRAQRLRGTCTDVSSLQSAQEAVRRGEERYGSLYNNTPALLQSLDRSGRIVMVSDYWLRSLGYERGEVVGRELIDFLSPDSRKRMLEGAWPDFLGGGVLREIPTQFCKKDGDVLEALLSAVQERDAGGEITGSLAVSVDVTDRRRTRAELQEQLHFVIQLLDAIPNPVFYKDEQARYLGCNRAFEEFCGLSRGDLIGRTLRDIRPEKAAAHLAVDRELINQPGHKAYAFQETAPDGSPQHMLLQKATFLKADGSVGGVVGVMTDLSEQKRGEESLRNAEAELRLIMDSVPALIEHLDRDARFTFVNRAHAEFLEREPGEIIGRTIEEVVEPERHATVLPNVRRALAGERVTFERSRRRRDGTLRWLALTYMPDVAASGEVQGYYGLHVDITERKRAEHALQQSEARFRALTQLSADWFLQLDERYRFVSAGAESGDKSKMRPPDFIGMTPWETPGTSLSAAEWAAFRARLDARLPYRDFEYSRPSADGRLRYVSVSGEPVFDAEGRFRGYRGVGRDITARKAEERLLGLEHAVTKCLANADSVPDALREVMQTICESEKWDCGRYFHHDESAGVMRFGQAWSSDDAAMRRFNAASDGLEYAPGAGLLGLAWQSGKPVWSADATRDPRVAQAALARDAGLHGVFVFPAVFEGSTFGMLSISSREIQEPDDRLLRSMGVIASQIGQFLARKRAEEGALRFRQALDHSADIIILTDRATMRHVDVNDTACRLLGYSREELLAMGPADVLPVTRRALEAVYDELIASPSAPNGMTSYYRCKNGSRLPFESTRRLLRTPEGWLVAAISRDIRERIAADSALAESEARFRALTHLSSDWFWEQDEELRFTKIEGDILGKFGIDTSEALGKRRWDLPFYVPLSESWAEHRRRVDAHQAFRDFEIGRIDETGNVVNVAVLSGEPLFDADGVFRGYRGVARDVTGRKAAEEQVRKLNLTLEHRVAERTEALSAANLELEAFSYSVSHDLRAPLRAIDGFSKLLEEELCANFSGAAQIPDGPKRMLGRIRANVATMGALIDGLIEFARLSRAPLTRVRVEPVGVVREVLEELAEGGGGRDIEFVVSPLPSCMADPLLLKQVYSNLIGNALKYSAKRERPRIEVGARLDGGTTVYFVRDNGAGFDMQFADKLFGVFERLHPASEFEGTGIGLATVRRIIARHGGEIRAEAVPDQGATFYFTLPGQGAAAVH